MAFWNQIALTVAILLGMIIGYFFRKIFASHQTASSEFKLRSKIESVKNEAETIVLNAKNKAAQVIEDSQKEAKEIKLQVVRLEERLIKREESIDLRATDIDHEKTFLKDELEKIKAAKERIDEMRKNAIAELERVSGLSKSDAKEELISQIQRDSQEELASVMQKIEKNRRDEIEKKSIEIMTSAMQRYSRSQVADSTVSTITLPSDELKGKIIGKEGRNIRTLERLTGVEIIVDETPGLITLSSFDPMRREIARLALEKLIKDGRIQPAKIEEKVEEARQDINDHIKKTGEEAAYEIGILDFPPEIILLLGRLSFRTSYGQNVLLHSVEMAHISGIIAAELHVNVEVAKKGALLHDIGKAVDHEVQGTHVEIGRKILKKYGIEDSVVKAMEAHHEDYPFQTPESYIVAAADAISAARPGARRDTIENYIKRLEDLEALATEFPGVKNAYAISAGREIRVFVEPEKIDDFAALRLAKNIASKVESELRYPGEIKVNVIREIRAVEYAK